MVSTNHFDSPLYRWSSELPAAALATRPALCGRPVLVRLRSQRPAIVSKLGLNKTELSVAWASGMAYDLTARHGSCRLLTPHPLQPCRVARSGRRAAEAARSHLMMLRCSHRYRLFHMRSQVAVPFLGAWALPRHFLFTPPAVNRRPSSEQPSLKPPSTSPSSTACTPTRAPRPTPRRTGLWWPRAACSSSTTMAALVRLPAGPSPVSGEPWMSLRRVGRRTSASARQGSRRA